MDRIASVDTTLIMADDISTIDSSAVVTVTLDVTELSITEAPGSHVVLVDSSVINFCTGFLGTIGSTGTS